MTLRQVEVLRGQWATIADAIRQIGGEADRLRSKRSRRTR